MLSDKFSIPNTFLTKRLADFEAACDAASASIWIERGIPVIGATTGALAGKIAAIKDNIDLAGHATTAACPDFAYWPKCSATAVKKLLAAGVSIVGKTNLDQFACGLVGTRSPYGAVPNAFNSEYISGGSSSGSAVAVALGLVDFALGTDTAGSGRVPAGFNNIVGLKPSRGLVSARGVFPACRHIDCVSIFARTVPDAVEVLLTMAGPDAEDPFSRKLELDPRAMPEAFRMGILKPDHLNFFGDAQAEAAFASAVELLRQLGGTSALIDYTSMKAAASTLYEGPWLAERYAAIQDFFNSSSQSMDPVVRQIIDGGKNHSAADLFNAMGQMGLYRQKAALLWNDLDVLVVPTAPTIYKTAEIEADPINLNRNLGYYTNFVNLLDMAAIAVPASIRPDGLPFGITLIGPAGSELRLADLAQRFHLASGLTLGISNEPVPDAGPIPRTPGSMTKIVVAGAHMSGLPLNGQLLERGARWVAVMRTAPIYRLYALAVVADLKLTHL